MRPCLARDRYQAVAKTFGSRAWPRSRRRRAACPRAPPCTLPARWTSGARSVPERGRVAGVVEQLARERRRVLCLRVVVDEVFRIGDARRRGGILSGD